MNPYRKTTRTDKNHVNRYEKQIFGHLNLNDNNHMIKLKYIQFMNIKKNY